MAVAIKVPDSAWHSQIINLRGRSYQITFTYNASDAAWYFDLYTSSGTPLDIGVKVMPNQNLTGRFPYRQVMFGGNIWCLRRLNDFSPINRDNLGIGKTYELVWLTSEEELEEGIDGTIQL